MYDKIEDMARIFSIFHDGLVESWSLDGNDLKLAIDILYLAERIDPGYRTFYVTIFDVTRGMVRIREISAIWRCKAWCARR